jgi:hypothetical protein
VGPRPPPIRSRPSARQDCSFDRAAAVSVDRAFPWEKQRGAQRRWRDPLCLRHGTSGCPDRMPASRGILVGASPSRVARPGFETVAKSVVGFLMLVCWAIGARAGVCRSTQSAIVSMMSSVSSHIGMCPTPRSTRNSTAGISRRNRVAQVRAGSTRSCSPQASSTGRRPCRGPPVARRRGIARAPVR